MMKIDNGAPAHNPLLQVVTRSWRTETVQTDDGPRDAEIADYTCADKPLDEIKRALKDKLDADAERVRLTYITPGAGMALTYQEKFAQATAVNRMTQDAANAMSATERAATFPLLDASVGLEAPTLWDVSQLVLARFAAFAQVARVIEQRRIAGKQAVASASNSAAAVAAYEAVTWN